MKERSIKGKMLGIIVGVAFGLAGLIFIVSVAQMFLQKSSIEDTNRIAYKELSEETKDKLEEMNKQVAKDFSRLYSERINENFKQIRENVESVANYVQVLYGYNNQIGSMDNMLGIMPGANRESLRNEFLALKNIRDFINSIPDYDSSNLDPLDLYIATENGMCMDGTDGAGYKDILPGEYADLRKASWYKGAKKAGKKSENKYYWTSMFTGSQSGKDKINCAVPFYNEKGEFAGVTAGDITKEHIKEAVLEISDNQLDYIILFNEENQVMLNPYDYKDVDSLEIKDEVKLQDGNIITYTTLSENNWKVCLIFRQDAIKDALNYVETSIQKNGSAISVILEESIKKSIFISIIIAAAGAVFALAATNIAANSLANPIKQLMKQVKQVGTGNLNQTITVKSRDEIGELAVCFDTMTKELKEYMTNVTAMTADKERTAAELNVARQIQKNMLPHRYPAFPERKDMDIYWKLFSVSEGGGNFYDFFFIDSSHFCILVGNAAGSGILTTLMAVIAKTYIKNYAQLGYPTNRILAETNNQLSHENEMGMSVSVFLAIVDISAGQMEYANAGFIPPLWKHSGKEFVPIPCKSCAALGIMENIPFTSQTALLVQGDLLCFYSDGLSQSVDSRNNVYSAEHFNDFMNGIVKKEFELMKIGTYVEEELEEFREGKEPVQDWTVVLFRYFG